MKRASLRDLAPWGWLVFLLFCMNSSRAMHLNWPRSMPAFGTPPPFPEQPVRHQARRLFWRD
jgi:hypothetical protein